MKRNFYTWRLPANPIQKGPGLADAGIGQADAGAFPLPLLYARPHGPGLTK